MSIAAGEDEGFVTARGSNYGWLSTFQNLPGEDSREIRESLRDFVRDASREQLAAWDQSVPLVKDVAAYALSALPITSSNSVVMEYELPREGGRRPDVVVLNGGVVVVLEFKGWDYPRRSDLDQVAAYARDLRAYHEGSHGRHVIPVLVPMRFSGPQQQYDDVVVVSPAALADFLIHLTKTTERESVDGFEWADADYAPLPSLIQAARLIFQNRPLPFIRMAQSAGIPEALDYLIRLAHRAAASHSRHLALLTGVPGSGKTLVGLQFVHDRQLDDLIVQAAGRATGAPAVFLSGNGPLVRVLRHALKGDAGEEKIFVDGIKNYLKQYVLRKVPRLPPEHVLVFDEAQRAWDGAMVQEKQGVAASEPEIVIRLSSGVPEWSMVLGLVGEGQEIHKGEEAGIVQWADALVSSPNSGEWVVHGPTRLRELFAPRGLAFEVADALDLTVTLRSHLSSTVHRWVNGFLGAGNEDTALLARLASEIRKDGFCMYVTRTIGAAAAYAQDRYAGLSERRFGLLASSRARNLETLGIDNTYQATKQLREGPWYNDPPESPFSCCQLRTVATEFSAQGLELDLPIVCWGDDLYRSGNGWQAAKRKLGREYRDPQQLRINSYRVLLTRGRDGFVVFIPPDRGDCMDATADFLEQCGLLPLGELGSRV